MRCRFVVYSILIAAVNVQEPTNSNSRRCVIRDKIGPSYNTCTSAYTILLRNTNISSLNLLNRIKTIHPDNMFYPVGSPSIEIYNNSELVWSPEFLNLTVATTISNGFLRLYINENSRLCIPETERKRLETVFNEETRIQKCTCVVEGHTPDGIPILSGDGECKILDSDLVILNIVHEQLDPETHRRLSLIERVNGQVFVSNTSLTTLSFLSGLISIHSPEFPSLVIIDNPKLARLGFRGLQSVHAIRNSNFNHAVYIDNNTKLGLSGEDVAMLHNAVYLEKTVMEDIDEENDPIFLVSVTECTFKEPYVTAENYKQLELCVNVAGNIVINENTDVDETHLHHAFYKIEHVFGCMTFNNTRYKDFDFFAHLSRVFCAMNGSAAITISHNKHLKRIGFSPSMVASMYGPAYVIHDNLLVPQFDIDVIQMLQENMRNHVHEQPQYLTERSMEYLLDANYSFEYDNKKFEHPKGQDQMARSWILISVAFIIFAIFLIIFEIIMYRRQRKAAKDQSPPTTYRSLIRRRA